MSQKVYGEKDAACRHGERRKQRSLIHAGILTDMHPQYLPILGPRGHYFRLAGPFLRNHRKSRMLESHLRSGDVALSRFTSGSAADTTGWSPVTISLGPTSLPYSFLLASLSESIDAPSRDTPAKSPLDRE